MRITKNQLRQIIKEELSGVLTEGFETITADSVSKIATKDLNAFYNDRMLKPGGAAEADVLAAEIAKRQAASGKSYKPELDLFSGPDNEIADFSDQDPNITPDTPMDWDSMAMRYNQMKAGVPINYTQTSREAYPEGVPEEGLGGPLGGDDQGPHPAFAGDEDVRSQHVKESRRRRKVRKTRRK